METGNRNTSRFVLKNQDMPIKSGVAGVVFQANISVFCQAKKQNKKTQKTTNKLLFERQVCAVVHHAPLTALHSERNKRKRKTLYQNYQGAFSLCFLTIVLKVKASSVL